MKRLSKKKQITSAHYGVEVLFDHSAQYPAAGLEDERTDQIGIDHLTSYIDRITQARADGYWSVLREEL